MSFRRKRDEWDGLLKRHGAELRACGVPDYVTADRDRFLRFLGHGFDQDGRFESKPSAAWSADLLAPEQAGRLANFLERHFGEGQYRDLLRELRRRADSAEWHHSVDDLGERVLDDPARPGPLQLRDDVPHRVLVDDRVNRHELRVRERRDRRVLQRR